MKKMVVLCHQQDRSETVRTLQDLGVMHVLPAVRPEGPEIDNRREKLDAAERALSELTPDPKAKEAAVPTSDVDLRERASQAILTTLGEATKRQSMTIELEEVKAEIERVTPLGDFSPDDITALAGQGVQVSIVKDTERKPATIDGDPVIVPLSDTRTERYRVVLSDSEITVSDGEIMALPDTSLQELKARQAEFEHQLSLSDWRLAELSGHRALIERWVAAIKDHLQFLEAEAGMANHGEQVAYIQGFCPADAVADVERVVREQSLGLWVTDTAPEDDVPTYIRRPKWVEPIKGVFDVIGIFPGYKEIDISSVFLIFFSIFFAMIIGDGGYGLLFLGLSIYAQKKFPHAPAYPFTLMKLLSACTIVWGVLTGNFFGIQDLPAALEKLKFPGADGAIGLAILVAAFLLQKNLTSFSDKLIKMLFVIGGIIVVWGALTGNIFGLRAVPGLLELARADWLNDENNLMRLCFLLGSVHLTIAHGWNALTIMNSTKAIAQLGWILVTWAMYALACNMILSEALPFWFNPALAIGFVLVLLFMNTRSEIKKEAHAYFVLPLDVIGNFVDVVSYVRLFAVGMASLAIAMNFNEMALAKEISGPVSALIAGLILFAGHGLNILLCIMGVLVHGVRLNTLEFSRHIGIQWAGHAFAPLHRSEEFRATSSPERR